MTRLIAAAAIGASLTAFAFSAVAGAVWPAIACLLVFILAALIVDA